MQLVGQTDCGLSDVVCCGGEPVTLSSDGEVEVWLGSQRRLVTEGVSSMVSLPDGRLVVGRSDGYLEFWDVATAGWTERVRGRVPGPIRCLASDATGRFLAASTGDNDLTVWRDGRRRWTSRAVHITIYSVAIGRDGRVYTGGGRDRSILLSDLEIGNEICRLKSPGKDVHALVVSRDARQWLSCGDCSEWMLWPAEDPQPKSLETNSFGVCALETPDGRAVLVAGHDQRTGKDQLVVFSWAGAALGALPCSGRPKALAWGAGGEFWMVTRTFDWPDPPTGSTLWRDSWDSICASVNRSRQTWPRPR